jgi:sulfatase modifying factor 1
MGSDDFYPEERPAHEAGVEGFWIDRHPVTVRDFWRFVDETGYVTLAERPPDPAAYPGADPALSWALRILWPRRSGR